MQGQTTKNKIVRKKIVVDASKSTVGRIASKIAVHLMGKDRAGYAAYIDSGANVVVVNAAGARFSGKKIMQKEYRHHSMHPGGLKSKPAKELMLKNPEEIIRHAVSKMLPRNKTRAARMKRLTFVR